MEFRSSYPGLHLYPEFVKSDFEGWNCEAASFTSKDFKTLFVLRIDLRQFDPKLGKGFKLHERQQQTRIELPIREFSNLFEF